MNDMSKKAWFTPRPEMMHYAGLSPPNKVALKRTKRPDITIKGELLNDCVFYWEIIPKQNVQVGSW